MKSVTAYTDGACSGNPGDGGWAAVLIYKGVRKEFSGGMKDTTNNRMELLAVISVFEALREKCEVTVYSDSKYVVEAFNSGWLEKWRANYWQKKGNKPLPNADLWQRLDDAMDGHETDFVWVKGHACNDLNNRCDELARKEIGKLRV